MALYNNEGAVVPGRAILSNNENSYLTSNQHDYGNDKNNPSTLRNYPFIQCVAYINKTHSKR